MLIPGHLAAGVLVVAAARGVRRRPSLSRALLPALIGALTPDLIDKPLQFLGLVSGSRTVAHSPSFVAAGAALLLLALLPRLLFPVLSRRSPRPLPQRLLDRPSQPSPWLRQLQGLVLPIGLWLLGVISHLVADTLDERLLNRWSRPTPLELLTIALALVVIWAWVRRPLGGHTEPNVHP